MPDDKPIELKIQRLENRQVGLHPGSRFFPCRGLESAGMALFVKAAELELDLAGLFRAQGDERNAQVSLRMRRILFLASPPISTRAARSRNRWRSNF